MGRVDTCICMAESLCCSSETITTLLISYMPIWLPRWHSDEESTCHGGDSGSITGSGRSPGEGNGNPLQYSCLESSVDRGTWWATVHGDAKSWTRLSRHTYLTNPAVQHRKALLFLLKLPYAILSCFCHSLSSPYRHLH